MRIQKINDYETHGCQLCIEHKLYPSQPPLQKPIHGIKLYLEGHPYNERPPRDMFKKPNHFAPLLNFTGTSDSIPGRFLSLVSIRKRGPHHIIFSRQIWKKICRSVKLNLLNEPIPCSRPLPNPILNDRGDFCF